MVFVSFPLGFPFVHLVKEPLVVGDNEQFIKQELDEDGNVGKNTIMLDGKSVLVFNY